MNDKVLGLLGIARRASKVSLGHDAVLSSIRDGGAYLCLMASDASDRLKNEFVSHCENTKGKTAIIMTEYTMNEIGMCQGAKKTAVMSVNDEGFAQKITQLVREGK